MEGNNRPPKYRLQVERSVEWSRSETALLASAYESLVPRAGSGLCDRSRGSTEPTRLDRVGSSSPLSGGRSMSYEFA